MSPSHPHPRRIPAQAGIQRQSRKPLYLLALDPRLRGDTTRAGHRPVPAGAIPADALADTVDDAMPASGGTQLLAGVAVSVGLMLVMVTGTQLFTGNAMPGPIDIRQLWGSVPLPTHHPGPVPGSTVRQSLYVEPPSATFQNRWTPERVRGDAFGRPPC